MLRRIFAAFMQKEPETPPLHALLAQVGAGAPARGWPDPDGGSIPALAGGRMLHDFYDPFCPVRSAFRDVMARTPRGRESVSLQAVEGCTQSKSHLTSFEKMRGGYSVREIIAKKGGDVESLAAGVFEGSGDCIARKDGNAQVFRQAWDRKQWFSNEGGSHRAAAVWALDRDAGRERMISCDIVEFDIAPRMKDICRTHSVFVFKARDSLPLLLHSRSMEGQGVLFHQAQDDCCLIVPKAHPEYRAAKDALPFAFDFSAWAENPAAYHPAPKNHPAIRAASLSSSRL